MKTQLFKTGLIALFITLSQITRANAVPDNDKSPVQQAARIIQRNLKFPATLAQPAHQFMPLSPTAIGVVAQVEVLFTINRYGKVDFVQARTKNEALKAEIEKQFYLMQFPEGQEKLVQRVMLRFRVI